MSKQQDLSTQPIILTSQSSHCVIYRTGGTVNFEWHRTVAMSRQSAFDAARDSARMGYPCHIEAYAQSVAVGLPTTYAPGFPGVEEWN